jgi:hypothetical protein
LFATVVDLEINTAPLLNVAFLTWAYHDHRAIFLVVHITLSAVGVVGGWTAPLYTSGPALWAAIVAFDFFVGLVLVSFCSQWQRGVVDLALRTWDFWYLSYNYAVLIVVGKVDVIVTYDVPWVTLLAVPAYFPFCVMVFASDAIDDHRIRAAIVIAGLVSFVVVLVNFLFLVEIRNRPIHDSIAGVGLPTWGALGVTAVLQIILLDLKVLRSILLGRSCTIIPGLERDPEIAAALKNRPQLDGGRHAEHGDPGQMNESEADGAPHDVVLASLSGSDTGHSNVLVGTV